MKPRININLGKSDWDYFLKIMMQKRELKKWTRDIIRNNLKIGEIYINCLVDKCDMYKRIGLNKIEN